MFALRGYNANRLVRVSRQRLERRQHVQVVAKPTGFWVSEPSSLQSSLLKRSIPLSLGDLFYVVHERVHLQPFVRVAAHRRDVPSSAKFYGIMFSVYNGNGRLFSSKFRTLSLFLMMPNFNLHATQIR